MSPAKTTDYLPDVCWEIIFELIDHHGPLSLVNKHFLAITNLARTTLTVPSTLPSPRLYTRFPNLKFITLAHRHPDLDGFIRQLAGSSLPLHSLCLRRQARFPREAMRLLGRSDATRSSLKTLSCTAFGRLDDDDLLVVAECFSYLQRLELYHSVYADEVHTITDRGILAVSIKLRSLVSLVLCCNKYVTDQSFHSLSSNCPLLSDLKIRISSKCLVCIDYFSSFESLSSLDLNHVHVSESGLLQLSLANLKIWKLVLRSPAPRIVNCAAICRFLASCRSLRHLVLKYADVSEDGSALDFVASIPNVNFLHITNVGLITPTILFDLLEGCPNLEDLFFKMSYVEIVKYSSDKLPIHCRLRKLFLGGWGLSDEILMLIGSICPNLESFSFIYDFNITDRGIEAIRTSCCNIKHLDATGCERLSMVSST